MRKIVTLLLPLICFIIYVTLTSSSGGINGVSVSGCSCHGAISSNTFVSITGLPSGGYTNGAVYSITVSVTNNSITPLGVGLRDGFDLTASSGAFTAITGTALNGALEIRHNTPKVPVSGTASWTFNWTAPVSGSANVNFFVSGNATNGSGNTSGDQWNQASMAIPKTGTPLSVTSSASAIACSGGTSTITASAIGGTPPYTFQRNVGTFQASNLFTANLANTYTITIKDATTATTSTVLTINQPTLLVPNSTNTAILCNGNTSTITASGTGGTGAYNYQLNTGTYQASTTFANLAPNTYTVTVRDANLCTKTTTKIITQPSLIVPSSTNTAILCNGNTSTITASGTGGTGAYNYQLNTGTYQTSTSFSNLNAGTYTVTVRDANLCTRTTTKVITEPTPISIATPTFTQPSCSSNNGLVNMAASGGTGTITYTISPLGPQSNTTGSFSNLTAQTYTITATDANFCSSTSTILLNNLSCSINLNVKLFLEGYYDGTSLMKPVLFNQGITANSTICDTVTVELHNAISYALEETYSGIVSTNGIINCVFPYSINANSYYIVVKHRNSIETWSANPVLISTNTSYDFTDSISKALGNNLIDVFTEGIYSLYSGDINQDGYIDGSDYPAFDYDTSIGLFGEYVATDLNGDGYVDGSDFPLFDANSQYGVYSITP